MFSAIARAYSEGKREMDFNSCPKSQGGTVAKNSNCQQILPNILHFISQEGQLCITL